ncbi:MAG: hypothetical protein V1900_00500 [Candidatus Aenigmatarchaeota archaeon]
MITFYIYGEGADLARRILGRACSLSGFEVQDLYASIGYVKIDKGPLLSKDIPEPDIILAPDKKASIKTKDPSIVIVNSVQKIAYKKGVKCHYLDADKIANTTNADLSIVMLGALTKVFSKLSLKNMREAIRVECGEDKITGLEEGFRAVR